MYGERKYNRKGDGGDGGGGDSGGGDSGLRTWRTANYKTRARIGRQGDGSGRGGGARNVLYCLVARGRVR